MFVSGVLPKPVYFQRSASCIVMREIKVTKISTRNTFVNCNMPSDITLSINEVSGKNGTGWQRKEKRVKKDLTITVLNNTDLLKVKSLMPFRLKIQFIIFIGWRWGCWGGGEGTNPKLCWLVWLHYESKERFNSIFNARNSWVMIKTAVASPVF